MSEGIVMVVQIQAGRTPAHTTITHLDRDFVEWHCGVDRYGVWVVMIEDHSWLEWFTACQRLVADLVLPGYRRQPHVTVHAAGLLSPEHLSQSVLDAQVAACEQLAAIPATMTLRSVGLGASRSVPFIEVSDEGDWIEQIRTSLIGAPADGATVTASAFSSAKVVAGAKRVVAGAECEPSVPGDATPSHLTLGLFNQALRLDTVRRRLAALAQPELPPLNVGKLSFCSYDTRSVQGRLRVDRELRWRTA